MGFQERINLANNMESKLVSFLKLKNFMVEKTGYEHYISPEMREKLRTIHTNPTVTFLRYLPDYFAIYEGKYFFIEFKVMDSPIRLDSRVEDLKSRTGIDDLSKNNIGVVETAAINNYQRLSDLGVKILVVVYCTFNNRLLLVDWENNIIKFFNDKVKIGDGNASFTPFTNIHLDKMKSIKDFMLSEFNISISKDEEDLLIKSIQE